MARSVAIVGAGQIGYAAWRSMAEYGWEPLVYARSHPSWLSQRESDFVPYVAGDDAAPEADAVIDTIAFDAEDIERYDPDKIGRLVIVSSASVYCDDHGRTLDEAAQNGFPEFNGPITEEQSTVTPGPETYSTRKVRMENKALELFGDRATILRPCAIYGPHSRHPREWWFVKRMLDGRDRIPLIHSGTSVFQTTNVRMIGDFAVGAIDQETGGVFNLADDPIDVFGIGTAIAQYLEKSPELVRLEGASSGFVGRTPWSVPKPFIVSSAKSLQTAHPVQVRYELEVEETIRWICDLNPIDWRATFPQLAAYPWDMFDYEAEDCFFETLA